MHSNTRLQGLNDQLSVWFDAGVIVHLRPNLNVKVTSGMSHIWRSRIGNGGGLGGDCGEERIWRFHHGRWRREGQLQKKAVWAVRLVCLCLKEGWWVVFKVESESAYQKDGFYTESPLHPPPPSVPYPILCHINHTNFEDLNHGG